jgi:DNA polymerase-1
MNALALIEKMRARSGAENTVVHMTTPGCHKGERYLIATVKPYQGQRSGSRRPKNHGYLQEWLMGYEGDAFKVKNWKTREADDGIAVCAYHAAKQAAPGYIVIATADKDMRMLPGLHIDWKTHKLVRVMPGDFEVYGEPEGDKPAKLYGSKWFWMQMLMGDAADNIPGLPKYCTTDSKGNECLKPMGEKTAEKFLERVKCNAGAFAEVYGLYQEYYGGNWPGALVGGPRAADDAFCEQAALLWMRTDNAASINNFATHTGPGCISEAFPDELRVAAAMLVKRVEKLRNEANALSA